MKYPATKVLIILASVVATAGVWSGLAWKDWHPAAPVTAAARAVQAAAPPPTPVPTEPPPPPVATPLVIHNIVYVPISHSESGDAPPPADEGTSDWAPAEPAPVYAPDPAPAPQPVVQQPAPQPVVPAPPPPVAAPVPTPIVSEGS